MSEAQIGQGYLSYLQQHTYPDAFPTHSKDWSRLLRQRGPVIEKSRELIAQIAPAAPLYTCTIAWPNGKVDFDFANKKPYDLSTGLYDAVANGKLAYDTRGHLVIARAGQQYMPQPFEWDPVHDKKAHFLFDQEKVVKVPPHHIAVQLQKALNELLNPNGFRSGADNALLLGRVTGDQSPSRALLSYLGIPD